MNRIPDETAPRSREPGDRRGRTIAQRVRRGAASLLASLHRWAASGWAGPAVLLWGIAHGAIMPGPTEAVLLPLIIAEPRRAPRLSAWACAGSIIGGVLAWIIGAAAFHAIAEPALRWAGAGAEIDTTRALLQRRGVLFVFLAAALPPFPAKVVCVVAGAARVDFARFVFALAAGRALRFGALALLFRLFGDRVLGFAERFAGRPLDEVR